MPPSGGKVTARFVLQCLPRRSRAQITPDRVNHWVEQFGGRLIKTPSDVLKFVNDLWAVQKGLSGWEQRKIRVQWDAKLAADGHTVIQQGEKIPPAPYEERESFHKAIWDVRTQSRDVVDRQGECPVYFKPEMSGFSPPGPCIRPQGKTITLSEPSPDGGRQ